MPADEWITAFAGIASMGTIFLAFGAFTPQAAAAGRRASSVALRSRVGPGFAGWRQCSITSPTVMPMQSMRSVSGISTRAP